jgi:hypothetical protein
MCWTAASVNASGRIQHSHPARAGRHLKLILDRSTSPFVDGHERDADAHRGHPIGVAVMLASFRDWFALQLDNGRAS